MSSTRSPSQEQSRQAIPLSFWSRVVFGFLGVCGVVVGTVAVFVAKLEGGPVALLALGGLFLLVSLSGVLPTKLKIGESEAEWTQYIRRMEESTPELEDQLAAAGVTTGAVLSGTATVTAGIRTAIEPTVRSLSEGVQAVVVTLGAERIPSATLLQLANWNAAEESWSQAAHYYDLYVLQAPWDWEAQFARGVGHANSRQGRYSDLAALSAYDAALAARPEDIPTNALARLLIYRGAIKKRLGRLSEAEADVGLGRQLASEPYEKLDATYNLASIQAMKGNRDAAIAELRELVSLGGASLVIGHLDDYFSTLRDDPEFQSLLTDPTESDV